MKVLLLICAENNWSWSEVYGHPGQAEWDYV